MGLSIFTKEDKLGRGGDITGLLEVTVQGGWLMERYASIESFSFARDVIGSTRRFTIFDTLALIVLQRITTPSFVSLDMFDV